MTTFNTIGQAQALRKRHPEGAVKNTLLLRSDKHHRLDKNTNGPACADKSTTSGCANAMLMMR